MNKILAIAITVLLWGLAISIPELGDRLNAQQQNDIQIELFQDSGQTSFVVHFGEGIQGDEAIVQTCYWTDFDLLGFAHKIVRCKESVIPVEPGAAVLVDPVPVMQINISRVRVRIVKNLLDKIFPYHEKPPMEVSLP
jgi:hypothetical protein